MLAIILARGGSKEVPNKNIKMLGNKRLSHYALDALIKTSINCRIVYSSDNVSYLSLAEAFLADNNAEQMQRLVLHNRSAEMAGDHVSSWEAVAEILTMMNIDNFEPILLVSGVCPTLTPEDITLFVEKMENAQSGLTIRLNDYPVESTFCITDNGYVRQHAMSGQITARQQARVIYRPDGHLYWRLAGDIKNRKVFPDLDTLGVDLKKTHYLNIDTSSDFEYAKYVLVESND